MQIRPMRIRRDERQVHIDFFLHKETSIVKQGSETSKLCARSVQFRWDVMRGPIREIARPQTRELVEQVLEPAALVANHASIFLHLLGILDDAVNEIFSRRIDHRNRRIQLVR